MRHGIVAASVVISALTLASWIIVSPTSTDVTTTLPSSMTLTAATRSSPPPSTIAPTTVPTTTSLPDAVPDREFLDQLNGLRIADQLKTLARSASLDALAQTWVSTMVQAGELHHSELIYDVIEGAWVTAGENVGRGPSTAMVFDALVTSPSHRANIVNPDFTHVGIGVVRVDDVLWTAHLFAG